MEHPVYIKVMKGDTRLFLEWAPRFALPLVAQVALGPDVDPPPSVSPGPPLSDRRGVSTVYHTSAPSRLF